LKRGKRKAGSELRATSSKCGKHWPWFAGGFSTWWFELRGRELRRVATPHACAVRARPQMEKWYAGELHIVHQRKGALGTDDLLVVGVVSLKKGSQPALG
jgi:hypothetical protein